MMRQYLPLYVLFNLLIYSSSQEVITIPPAKDTNSLILEQVSNKLSNLNNIRYQYKRELNYASENYFHELVVDTYLEFTPTDNNLGFKYQADDEQLLQVNNGTEIFILNKKSNKATIHRKPNLSNVQHLSFLYNSPVTLHHMLPLIFKDNSISKTITDTTFNGHNFYAISFTLKNKALNNISGYRELPAGVTIRYQLLIDPSSYFPVEVLQRNNLNNDFIRTSFTDIDFTPTPPTESSWYYSSYSDAYKAEASKEFPALVKPGTLTPKWQLPAFENDATIAIEKYKNRVVLLEFWNKNCGYCISAVPKLNELYTKYSSRGLKLFAINVHDSKDAIKQFNQKNSPHYPTLYNGDTVAKSYGIDVYPTIVLIDKGGAILYSGIFDKKQIETLIDQNL